MALLTRKAIDLCLATAWVTCPDYSRTRLAMRACMLGTPLSSASPFSFKKLARFFCPFFFANKKRTGRKNNWHKRTSNSSSSWRDLQFPLIFEKNGSLLEKLCSNVSLQSLGFTMLAQCAALRCTEAHVCTCTCMLYVYMTCMHTNWYIYIHVCMLCTTCTAVCMHTCMHIYIWTLWVK